MIGALSRAKGVTLIKKSWPLAKGSWIELDGFCESPPVLCEAWAHIGPPKSAQKNKVMTDAYKLLFVSELINEPASEKYCCSPIQMPPLTSEERVGWPNVSLNTVLLSKFLSPCGFEACDSKRPKETISLGRSLSPVA